MKHVSLAEARANIAELLDEVERGGTVQISLEGGDSASQAFTEEQWAQAQRAMEGILELRKHVKPASVEEIIAWKNEGRR